MAKSLSGALLLAGLAATGAAAQTPLAGTWSADDATLVLGPEGGRLQSGCTLVTLAPVSADARGRFSAQGRIEAISVLPPDERADEDVAEPAQTRPAQLVGEVHGGAVTLELTAGGEAPRHLALTPGQHARPRRCL
jgi:hypothetical protein